MFGVGVFDPGAIAAIVKGAYGRAWIIRLIYATIGAEVKYLQVFAGGVMSCQYVAQEQIILARSAPLINRKLCDASSA